MFITPIHFHTSLIYEDLAGAYQRGAPLGLHSNGKPLALPTNIRLVCKWKEVTDTLQIMIQWQLRQQKVLK